MLISFKKINKIQKRELFQNKASTNQISKKEFKKYQLHIKK